VIPRFLPKAVGSLVALYLSYIRPFTDFIDRSYDNKAETDYLWATDKGDCWETERMSEALSEASERLMGVRLTIRSYRHVAVAFSRDVVHVHRPLSQQFKDFICEDQLAEIEDTVDQDTDLEQHLAALQTAHTSRLRLNHYAQNNDLISKFSSQSLEAFGKVSAEWHRFLGFQTEQSTSQVEDRGKKASRKRQEVLIDDTNTEEFELGKFTIEIFTRFELSDLIIVVETESSDNTPALKRQRSKTILSEGK